MVQRVGGLISGLDTDALVKALTLAQQTKIDKLKKQNTTGTWKQTEYRTIIDQMNDFKNKYFSAQSPLTNLNSSSNLLKYNSSILTNAGASSSAVSVSASGSVRNTAHTMSVQQLAQKETWTSNTPTKMQSTAIDIDAVNNAISADGSIKFGANVDGQIKTITLSGNYSDAAAFADDIQTKIAEAYGRDKVKVSATSDGKIEFATVDGNGKSNGHTFGLGNAAGEKAGIDKMGFSGLTYTTLKTDQTLNNISFANGLTTNNGNVEFTINGKSFSFDAASTTMQGMFDTINSSDAGVRMYYSEVNNAVVMESKNPGEANKIDWSDKSGSNFMESLFGASNSAGAANLTRTAEAQDAIFTLDGMQTSRSSNTFEVEGITYTLNRATDAGESLNINLTLDTSKTKDLLSEFVKDYNELIKYVNGKVREEKMSGYEPLTDDEKASLTEYEIKEWETNAKSGLLKNDTLLNDALRGLSNSVFLSKGASGVTAYSLGINQSGSFSDGGQLKLDLDQLEKALQQNPDAITDFFTSAANGLAKNMENVLTKVASTDLLTQGTLVTEAGYAGKSSEYFNNISAKARERNEQITTLLEQLTKKQNDLYTTYSKMEVTMNKMQSQISSLSGLG